MNVYMSEEEQIQVLKDWIKKYGLSIVLGIGIALIGSFAWRHWQQHEIVQSEQASMLYEQMLAAQSNHKADQLSPIANQLMTNYQRTPYAALAGLMAADNDVTQNNLSDAQQKLEWVRQHGKSSSLREIAAIREARVLLAQNKNQDALTMIEKVNNKNFMPAANIVKGDILLALGKTADARNAYQQALNALPQQAMIRSLVQMKSDQLAS